MSCKHLSQYTDNGRSWGVAICSAKGSPYVPSLKELERFCRGGAHVVCASFLAGQILPVAAERAVLPGCMHPIV